MKKCFLLLSLSLLCGSVMAFDLNQADSGMHFGPPDKERAKLFTDQKPVNSFLSRVGRKHVNCQIVLTPEKELKFSCLPGTTKAHGTVALRIPAAKKLNLSFEIKGENFFVSRKIRTDYPRFMIYAGSMNLFMRGNTGDIRYFDGTAKKYLRLTTMKNGEWLKVSIDINCGDTPTFSINDKKDVVQRGKCSEVKAITFSPAFFSADTTVSIKNLKVTAL